MPLSMNAPSDSLTGSTASSRGHQAKKLDALGKGLKKLDTELKNSEGDTEKIRALTELVETLNRELVLWRAVANDAQPAATSSSDAQLAAAIEKLEGAFQTIKAQQAEIEALAASIAAAKAAKAADKARGKKARAGRRAADARLLVVITEAMARNNVSPESSVSPESAADPTSPSVRVAPTRLYTGSSGLPTLNEPIRKHQVPTP
ncbi:hypothetical protein T484DRAFT_1859161 [Baffinella frigidus]|nr:hypothetical protein T484DRAFT_1859161 [Cryptophyta sp. CCMP2293]